MKIFLSSPYQPEFCDWAFNLPVDSPQIKQVFGRKYPMMSMYLLHMVRLPISLI